MITIPSWFSTTAWLRVADPTACGGRVFLQEGSAHDYAVRR